jgi:bifunctional protein TilS/HprT
MEFYERFKDFIDRQRLLPQGDSVVAAVSGGTDSMAMVHLLGRLREERPFRLGVVHVHHGIRGIEADEDAEFVRRAARAWCCDFHIEHVDTLAAAKCGRSIEEAARELRYAALERCGRLGSYSWIAVAHTADDQAETVLLNFVRGAAVRGLAGMPVRRGAIVRPLLFATRDEVSAYAATERLDYRHDSTNLDLRYRRNRVRHELLPYLAEHFNPNIAGLLLRNARSFREYEEDLERRAAEALSRAAVSRHKDKIVLDIETFLGYFSLIRTYAIFLILDDLRLGRAALTAVRMNQLLSIIERRRVGARFVLSEEWEVLVDRSAVVFQRGTLSSSEVKVRVGEEVDLSVSGVSFASRLLNRPPMMHRSHTRDLEFVDYDAIGNGLRIRQFRPGDRFWPLKAAGFKKVGDFFTDEKVPLHLRNRVPILESERGIVWVCGYRLDHRFRLTERTRRFLQIEIRRSSDGEIEQKVKELGRQISADYADKCPILIGVLNGGVIFFADLLRKLEIDCEVDFIKISSYGDAMETSGKVKIKKHLDADIAGRHVLVIEDIVDSGHSIRFLQNVLGELSPKSLRFVSLLVKSEAARVDYEVEYVGFRIPNRFVVGYGLDYAQKFRNLPQVYLMDG